MAVPDLAVSNKGAKWDRETGEKRAIKGKSGPTLGASKFLDAKKKKRLKEVGFQ